MNKITIIGRLTKDPEHRTTRDGIGLCSFTVAVNKKARDGKQEADFFKVTAWRQLGDICGKYLAKGKQVCVVGPVSLSQYTGQDGKTRANLEITAEDVEFLTPRGEAGEPAAKPAEPEKKDEYLDVTDDDLPF